MAPLIPNYNNIDDPEEEIFTPSPKIIKYDLEEMVEDKENQKIGNNDVVVKAKKNNVPSNITCHCAGNFTFT